MAENRRTQSMLLDFYGELLTDKQRECFDLHYNEDLSLSEIAEQLGISRQGVWDNIRRAESAMKEIEEKIKANAEAVELETGSFDIGEDDEADEDAYILNTGALDINADDE